MSIPPVLRSSAAGEKTGKTPQAEKRADPLLPLELRSAAQRWQRLKQRHATPSNGRQRPPKAARPDRNAAVDRRPSNSQKTEAAVRPVTPEEIEAFQKKAGKTRRNDSGSNTYLVPGAHTARALKALERMEQSAAESASQRIPERKRQKNIDEIQPYPDYRSEPIAPGEDNLTPEELSLPEGTYKGRQIPSTVFAWEPSNLSYNPLYFQDPALERYGHTFHPLIQPFASAGRFGVQLLGLPYQMSLDPLHKKRYALGYYRPGEPAPKLFHQIPWNLDAAVSQANVTTGLFFLIP